jgi:hypothetical protein
MNNLADADVARLKMDDGVVMQLGSKMYNQSVWWVVLRELIQNELDAGATKINIESDWDKTLIVEGNGAGMTKSELLGIFLTVGGSDKVRNSNTVGGFGIAKLAIFSCDDFEVVSNSWRLTKEILINHQPLSRTDEVGQRGTWVKIIKKDLISYYVREELKWYLKCINRPGVTFTIQNIAVEHFIPEDFKVMNYGTVKALKSSAPSGDSYVIVRANGLPIFKKSIFNATGAFTFFYDIHTELDPYDPNYPFTITRDDFGPDVIENANYHTFHRALDAHFRNLLEMEKQSKERLMYNIANDIWLIRDAVPNEENLEQLNIFKVVVETLYHLNKIPLENIAFGLMGKSHGGAHIFHEEKGIDIYFVTDRSASTSHMISSALHEFSHKNQADHYEGFAKEMSSNTEKLFAMILELIPGLDPLKILVKESE